MIGASLTCFSSQDFVKMLDKMSEEFTHWEIVAEGEHYLKNIFGIFREIAPSYNMTFSIHAPMSDINIGSLNERIREDSVIETINALDYAAEMNATSVTFHPGLAPMAVPQLREKAVLAAKKSIGILDRISADYGIPLCLENMPSFPFMLGRTVEEFGELYDDTNLPMCFDFGHANTNGQIGEFIKKYKGRIANVHIHDNHGEKDEHLACGDGKIDFDKHLKTMKSYGGVYVIESKKFEDAIKSKYFLERRF